MLRELAQFSNSDVMATHPRRLEYRAIFDFLNLAIVRSSFLHFAPVIT